MNDYYYKQIITLLVFIAIMITAIFAIITTVFLFRIS